MDLATLAGSIETEGDFLRFVKALLDPATVSDLPGTWRERSVESVLTAMLHWAESTDPSGRFRTPPDWALFAAYLLEGLARDLATS
jgi:hypothetical protein